jgi:hypothetical protein
MYIAVGFFEAYQIVGFVVYVFCGVAFYIGRFYKSALDVVFPATA